MKRLIAFVAVMLFCTVAFAGTPITVSEPFIKFSSTSNSNLDTPGLGTAGTGNSFSLRLGPGAGDPASNFGWSAFNVATTGTGNISVANSPGSLTFFGVSAATGSYAYTRFDSTSQTTRNISTTLVDGSVAGSKITVNVASNAAAGVQLSVLVRDNTGWWKSAATAIPTATTAAAFDYNLGTTPVGFTNVIMTTPGAIDMDEVDNNGEAAITFGSATNPNLASIIGMGLYLEAVTTAGNIVIKSLTLTGENALPAAPTGFTGTAVLGQARINLDWADVSGVAGYNVYRSGASGTTGTKLNATLLTASNYADLTVTGAAPYYYTVRSVHSSGIESANSTQISVTPRLVSSAQSWTDFK